MKETLERYILQNDLEKAIELLLEIYTIYEGTKPEEDISQNRRDLFAISGKLHNANRALKTGVIHFNDAALINAQVLSALLDEIHSLPKTIFTKVAEIKQLAEIQQKEKSGEIIWQDQKNGYFIDLRDQHKYKVVKIGKQIWMAENLAYKANSGCWAYDNIESNVEKYGYLYNWETARKVAPQGWHLPSDEEWKELEMFLGMTREDADKSYAWRGDGVGTKLKSANGWLEDGNGSNESGFNALPAGYRFSDGTFDYAGAYAYFWSSSPAGSGAWYRYLYCGYGRVNRSSSSRAGGRSVRPLKD